MFKDLTKEQDAIRMAAELMGQALEPRINVTLAQ
jgi:hypothetical protein